MHPLSNDIELIRDPYMYRLVRQEFDIYSYLSNHSSYKPLAAEVDEQGTYYGYKVLVWMSRYFISPVMEVPWDLRGFMCANGIPNEESKMGIHCLKVPFHNEILGYYYQYCARNFGQPCIVKCALSGTIVEGEIGFRAEQAQIIGVFENGNWQSYQDHRECAATYPRRNAEKERWEHESEHWRINARWYINPYSSDNPITTTESS